MRKTPLVLASICSVLWFIAMVHNSFIGAAWPLTAGILLLAIMDANSTPRWTFFLRTFRVQANYQHPFDGWDKDFSLKLKAHSEADAQRRFWKQEKAASNDVKSTKITEVSLACHTTIGEYLHLLDFNRSTKVHKRSHPEKTRCLRSHRPGMESARSPLRPV